MPARRVIEERLLKYTEAVPFDDSGCWHWTGAKSAGYGVLRLNKRNAHAHRVAYHLFVDQSLPIYPGRGSNDHLHHTCFNRGCVNPEHMKTGTHADNMRQPDTAIITEDIACAILVLVWRGIYQRLIADAVGEYAGLGRPYSAVGNIAVGRNWKGIQPTDEHERLAEELMCIIERNEDKKGTEQCRKAIS